MNNQHIPTDAALDTLDNVGTEDEPSYSDLAKAAFSLAEGLHFLQQRCREQERLLGMAWKYIPNPDKFDDYADLDQCINEMLNGDIKLHDATLYCNRRYDN